MTLARRTTAAGVALLVIMWMVAFTWEWSFIDDAGLKAELNAYTQRDGVSGVWSMFDSRMDSDRAWGLFRPAFHVYSAVFYLANPAVAHGIRLAMLLAVVLIPAFRIGYDWLTTTLAIAVLAANVTLYLGLSYLSLQELSGLTFVALGLWWDGPIRRSVLWLIAAWFKTPFVWLFLAWSVYLIIKRKHWAWLNVLAGLATVALAAQASRNGTYTQGFSLANVPAAIKSAIPLFFWPGLVGLASVIALRPRWRTIRWSDPLAWILLAGGALYLANLLPWGHADSYYGAPPIWLMSVGVLRLVWPAERAEFRWATPMTAGAATCALLAGAYVCQKMTRQQLARNTAVVAVRDWAAAVPGSETIGLNGMEGAERLEQILTFRGAPREIAYVDDTSAETPGYYVFFHDQSNGNPRLQKRVIKRMTMATIYATS